jgi:hypothetical protein
MAHFRAFIRGGRGEASRLGHKGTGITATVQTWGWNVEISARHMSTRGANGEDVAEVELVHSQTGERKHVAFVNLSTGNTNATSLGGAKKVCYCTTECDCHQKER